MPVIAEEKVDEINVKFEQSPEVSDTLYRRLSA
jgi:hypothetical protein